jgi:hypothetical protein
VRARHVAIRPPGRGVLVRMRQDKAKERTDAQASQLSILLTLAYVLRESCAPALQPQCISAQCYLLAMKLTVFISCQNEISTVKKRVDTSRCSEGFTFSTEP